jgi:hypothetical protein
MVVTWMPVAAAARPLHAATAAWRAWRRQARASTRCCASGALRVSLGGFDTAEAAARAIDDAARARGLPQLLNFPANAAERAAVAAYNAQPAVAVANAKRARLAEKPATAAAGVQRGGAPAPHKKPRAEEAPPGGKAAAKQKKAATCTTTRAAARASAHASPAKRRRVMQSASDDDGEDTGVVAPPDDAVVSPAAAAAAAAAAAPPTTVAPAAPPVAPPPAANHAGAGADHAEHGAEEVSQLLAFLRGITPPLSNLPAVLAAARGSRITLPHLAQLLASSSPASQQLALGIATSALRIDAPGDRMAFALALAPLTQRAGGDGGSGGGAV